MIPVVVPGGALIAAAAIRRRDEESQMAEPSVPTSTFRITVNEEQISIRPNVVNDFDWVRAAYALVRQCQKMGLEDALVRTLEQEDGS